MLRHVYMPTQHVNTSDVMPALIEEGGWLQREARQVPCTLTLSTPGRVVSCPRVQAGHTGLMLRISEALLQRDPGTFGGISHYQE